ncbi:dienelactone hydrolase family protein [Pseudomonas panipatensis]|jgi:dienelactone hydrolase|uniref:Dienelactone hydrolase n=1 Tax=Pseudomonas panipatensis TaxID=428992 RepID=A0A1G8FHY2_9PSED|nr:dienelactone hydrolase family protein [Pseudomonas panipatensis]SDH81750.1 Dienelactone hydrolase [Pseudomonas panipatensis]SMP53593.1 Dienelactone hydrolase [Pseudomonas panipatensis]
MSQISVQPVAYAVDGEPFEAQLVFDASSNVPRPGLLMAPNWMGVSQGALDIARQVAGHGYVVLVADLYGQRVRPRNGDEAGAAMMPLKNDRALLRKRMQAALEALQGQIGKAPIDADKLASFGFCFGGCCALELARAGAPLAAFVSFHGTLDTPEPADAKNIKGALLVLDGASDPLVPRDQLIDFAKEMTDAGVDWQLTSYGGAVHSFTDPNAQVAGKMQYDAKVARRAFQAMYDLLDERFGE